MDGIAHLSAIDEERFGFRVARADRVTLSTLPATLDFCLSNEVVLLIARCLVSEIETAQEMERKAFILTDTLISYSRGLTSTPLQQHCARVPIRAIRQGEEKQVEAVAAEAFSGYPSHYHADPRLSRVKCDEIYPSWALRSCISRDVAAEVLVADLNGSIVGFAALRLNSPKEGEAFLIGVSRSVQWNFPGYSLYQSLLLRGMEWCLSQGIRRMAMSTQLSNIFVQQVWAGLGFRPIRASYTFHKWFEAENED